MLCQDLWELQGLCPVSNSILVVVQQERRELPADDMFGIKSENRSWSHQRRYVTRRAGYGILGQ